MNNYNVIAMLMVVNSDALTSCDYAIVMRTVGRNRSS